jgi:hypothetical protein
MTIFTQEDVQRIQDAFHEAIEKYNSNAFLKVTASVANFDIAVEYLRAGGFVDSQLVDSRVWAAAIVNTADSMEKIPPPKTREELVAEWEENDRRPGRTRAANVSQGSGNDAGKTLGDVKSTIEGFLKGEHHEATAAPVAEPWKSIPLDKDFAQLSPEYQLAYRKMDGANIRKWNAARAAVKVREAQEAAAADTRENVRLRKG